MLQPMNKLTSIETLVAALKNEVSETTISFYEETDRENLYALIVGTDDDRLRNKLAKLFGCEEEDEGCFSEYTHFEVFPDWYERGKVNMRDLADEFIGLKGEFFNFSITVAELRLLPLRQPQ